MQDRALQFRERRQQVKNLRALLYQRQAHRFEGSQQALGRGLGGGACWLTGVQAEQGAVILCQGSPCLIFDHRQHPRRQGEQAGQSEGMVVAAHPERSQRQSPAFQTGAIALDQPLIPIRQDKKVE